MQQKLSHFQTEDPLRVTRFDDSWISPDRGEVYYELNRRDGTLTYARSTTDGNATTTIVGSGRCETAPAK
jgi:hypothetical protein